MSASSDSLAKQFVANAADWLKYVNGPEIIHDIPKELQVEIDDTFASFVKRGKDSRPSVSSDDFLKSFFEFTTKNIDTLNLEKKKDWLLAAIAARLASTEILIMQYRANSSNEKLKFELIERGLIKKK